MKTTVKLWTAIIFIAIAILMMIVDNATIFPIIFGLIGFAFAFAFWFYQDFKDIKFEDMTEEELDNFLGVKKDK